MYFCTSCFEFLGVELTQANKPHNCQGESAGLPTNIRPNSFRLQGAHLNQNGSVFLLLSRYNIKNLVIERRVNLLLSAVLLEEVQIFVKQLVLNRLSNHHQLSDAEKNSNLDNIKALNRHITLGRKLSRKLRNGDLSCQICLAVIKGKTFQLYVRKDLRLCGANQAHCLCMPCFEKLKQPPALETSDIRSRWTPSSCLSCMSKAGSYLQAGAELNKVHITFITTQLTFFFP